MAADIGKHLSNSTGMPKRPPESFVRARRHSRNVGYLKIGLPAGAAALVLLFAAWAWISAPEGFTTDITGSAVKDGKLVMANPKLNGFTKDNLPYAMTAERAVQDLTNAAQIELENINARLPIEADSWADIVAQRGVFDNESNTLDVTSPMTIKTNRGVVAKLKSAFVDIDLGSVISSEPVSIEMNGSTLRADTMTVEEQGQVIVFEGRVRMTVLPEQFKNRRDQ